MIYPPKLTSYELLSEAYAELIRSHKLSSLNPTDAKLMTEMDVLLSKTTPMVIPSHPLIPSHLHGQSTVSMEERAGADWSELRAWLMDKTRTNHYGMAKYLPPDSLVNPDPAYSPLKDWLITLSLEHMTNPEYEYTEYAYIKM